MLLRAELWSAELRVCKAAAEVGVSALGDATPNAPFSDSTGLVTFTCDVDLVSRTSTSGLFTSTLGTLGLAAMMSLGSSNLISVLLRLMPADGPSSIIFDVCAPNARFA